MHVILYLHTCNVCVCVPGVCVCVHVPGVCVCVCVCARDLFLICLNWLVHFSSGSLRTCVHETDLWKISMQHSILLITLFIFHHDCNSKFMCLQRTNTYLFTVFQASPLQHNTASYQISLVYVHCAVWKCFRQVHNDMKLLHTQSWCRQFIMLCIWGSEHPSHFIRTWNVLLGTELYHSPCMLR